MSNAKLKLISDNPAPRSARARTLGRRTCAPRCGEARDQSRKRPRKRPREHRQTQSELERAKATCRAQRICLDEYIQAVAADVPARQVKSVAVSSATFGSLSKIREVAS